MGHDTVNLHRPTSSLTAAAAVKLVVALVLFALKSSSASGAGAGAGESARHPPAAVLAP
jgi:hypothetical protein